MKVVASDKVVRPFVVSIVSLLALSVSTAYAATLSWDFTVYPTAETPPMVEYTGNTGQPTRYAYSGGWAAGMGLLGLGLAEYEESGSSNVNGSGQSLQGNYGFVYNGITTALTIEFKVKSLVDDNGRSLAFTQNTPDPPNVSPKGSGRGIRLLSNSMRVVGSSELANFAVDFTTFQLIRISLPDNGTATFYRYNGSSWELLSPTSGTNPVTSLGQTNVPDELVSNHGGVAVGALAGSDVTAGKFDIDYVRIENSVALTTEAPLVGPSQPSFCNESVSPAFTQTFTGYESGASNEPFASADLGSPEVTNGVTSANNGGDGVFTTTTQDGKSCHTAVGGNYMYFDVTTATSPAAVKFTVDYYDTDTGTLTLNYDTASNDYQSVPLVNLTADGAGPGWKTATVSVTDAQFANGENGGTDFRISGSATFYIDTVTLTEVGYTASFTVRNTGNVSPITWHAAEVDPFGVATDYGWLILSSIGGSLNEADSAVVNAVMSTTSLTAGTHTAYISFTNDECPSTTTAFLEPFTYTNGTALNGNGSPAWAGSASSSQIFIDSAGFTGTGVKLVGGGGDKDAVKTVALGTGLQVITVSTLIKAGGGSTFWNLYFNDSTGKNICHWYGSGLDVGARIQGAAGTDKITARRTLSGTSTWDKLIMKINPASKKVFCYFDAGADGGEVLMTCTTDCSGTTFDVDGILDFTFTGAVGAIGQIRFQRTGAVSDSVFFDDLKVELSAVYLRQIDLNVLGCQITLQVPRVRYLAGCQASYTMDDRMVFVVKNTGSLDWTGFSATEDEGDDDWLTLLYTSSPVNRFISKNITARIDWSQVPDTSIPDDQISHMQFTGTCVSGADNDELTSPETVLNNITVYDTTSTPPFNTYKLIYNGDVSPSSANSAGTGYRFVLYDTSVDQGTVVVDSGVGQADDGLAYLVTDASSTEQTLWRSVLNDGTTALPNIDQKVGATAVARVKVTSASGTMGPNLSILESTISAGIHWGGANNVVRDSFRNVSAVVPGDGAYHIIRVTSQDLADSFGVSHRVIKVYLDNNLIPVLTETDASSKDGDSGIDAIGFGSGSNAGLQVIYFDWVTGTNAGAFAPGEEVACIGSLIPAANCSTPKVDADGDGDVDMDDFGEFQKCYTGPLVSPPPLSQACDCFDDDNDNDVDSADFNHFTDCESGANVPWVTSGPCPN